MLTSTYEASRCKKRIGRGGVVAQRFDTPGQSAENAAHAYSTEHGAREARRDACTCTHACTRVCIVVIGIIKIRGLKLFRFMPALLSSCRRAVAPVTRRDSIPGNKFHALFRTRAWPMRPPPPPSPPVAMEAILSKKNRF